MAESTPQKAGKRSQAVSAKREAILSAALDEFSQYGIHGTRIERIAELANVSKTNLLYYYPSKDKLYIEVLERILYIWLAPLKEFRAEMDPVETISEYIRLKFEVARDHPKSSKLFCLEILQGAPLLMEKLKRELKMLVDDKTGVISKWVENGKLIDIDPTQLLFMIWATTQHYADFSTQVEAITGKTLNDNVFFEHTVKNAQQMIIRAIKVD